MSYTIDIEFYGFSNTSHDIDKFVYNFNDLDFMQSSDIWSIVEQDLVEYGGEFLLGQIDDSEVDSFISQLKAFTSAYEGVDISVYAEGEGKGDIWHGKFENGLGCTKSCKIVKPLIEPNEME